MNKEYNKTVKKSNLSRLNAEDVEFILCGVCAERDKRRITARNGLPARKGTQYIEKTPRYTKYYRMWNVKKQDVLGKRIPLLLYPFCVLYGNMYEKNALVDYNDCDSVIQKLSDIQKIVELSNYIENEQQETEISIRIVDGNRFVVRSKPKHKKLKDNTILLRSERERTFTLEEEDVDCIVENDEINFAWVDKYFSEIRREFA